MFLQQTHGDYLAVDVSGMERANIGYLGPDRHYERVETTSLKWLPRDDGLFHIQMRVEVWPEVYGVGNACHQAGRACLWQ